MGSLKRWRGCVMDKSQPFGFVEQVRAIGIDIGHTAIVAKLLAIGRARDVLTDMDADELDHFFLRRLLQHEEDIAKAIENASESSHDQK